MAAWRTRSAPCSSGRRSTGPRNVLSAMNSRSCRRAMARQSVEVGDAEAWVRRALDEQRTRRRSEGGLDRVEVGRIDPGHADAPPREVLVEQDVGDREQLVACHQVIAGARGGRRAWRRRPPYRTTTRPRPPRPRARPASPRAPGWWGCRSGNRSTRRAPRRATGRRHPPSPPPCRTCTWPSRRSACGARASSGRAAPPRGSPVSRGPAPPSARAWPALSSWLVASRVRPVYGRLSCADGSDRLVAPPRPSPRHGWPRSGSRSAHPGFAGDAKHRWRARLDDRFGPDGWRSRPPRARRGRPGSDRHRRVRGQLSAVPAGSAGARPVPRRNVRERLRLRGRERP